MDQKEKRAAGNRSLRCYSSSLLAVRTGLEPATPGVTGRYSNHLNYRTKELHQGFAFLLCWIPAMFPFASANLGLIFKTNKFY